MQERVLFLAGRDLYWQKWAMFFGCYQNRGENCCENTAARCLLGCYRQAARPHRRCFEGAACQHQGLSFLDFFLLQQRHPKMLLRREMLVRRNLRAMSQNHRSFVSESSWQPVCKRSSSELRVSDGLHAWILFCQGAIMKHGEQCFELLGCMSFGVLNVPAWIPCKFSLDGTAALLQHTSLQVPGLPLITELGLPLLESSNRTLSMALLR